ncbi:MAG: leucine-rich repeat domain-containing protein, partial [Eubacterium sp.]|nr:leucine-rich repeat domain-containing protein [Eubacterium sp.]
MKMELKKALSLILAFALILTLGISTGVYFDDEVNVNAADSETGSCGDNFTYTISGTTLYIDDDGTLSEAAEMTDYTINTVTGKSTAPWYASYYSTITTVIIQSEYLSNIGNAAFAGMTALTNVVINSDNSELVTIGNYAFYNCTALTTFAKGDDSGTLADTSEDSEIVLDDATSIGTCAFCGCSEITRVRLGASIASIGASAFSGCSD